MITNQNVKAWLTQFATNNDILLHSPAAMERFTAAMEPNIIRVRTPTGKYHSHNGCQLIDFIDEAQQKYYVDTYKRYIEDCEKLNKNPAEGSFLRLVLMNKFRFASDYMKCQQMLEKILHADKIEDKAVTVGVAFRAPIAKMVRTLIMHHGYTRNDISIIWGGDDTLDAKKQLSNEQIKKYVMDMALGTMPPNKIMRQIERQLVMSAEDQKEILDSGDMDLRLGNQSRQQRWEEIQRFQHGKSRICFFTAAAGGVGLSLHHTDIDERGRKVSLRPRRGFFTPPWSAQDFVQMLGRNHRSIFSISDTYNDFLFFRGTIEEDVMLKVSIKLRCLSKVIKARESWADAIWNGSRAKSDEERKKLILGSDINETVTTSDDENDEALNQSESSDEDEE